MIDRYGRFMGALALSLGMVLCTLIVGRSVVRVVKDNTISVTGSAKRRIKSDLIVWSAKVSSQASERGAAYKTVAGDMLKLTRYLEQKGIPKDKIIVQAVVTHVQHPRDKEGHDIESSIVGFQMEEELEVRSNDVDKVAAIARGATELIDQGVALESFAPEYHYTRLSDLKIQMLAEAAHDSHVRAEQICNSTGARLGALRSARMGVIQINPADSTETSNEGNNDVSSLDKDIITVVQSTFAMD
jgi:hypothetical protein